MNETVISYFAIPLTRQVLRLDPSTDTLVNAATGIRYPMDGNGTVHFLDRAAVAGRNRLWMKWYRFLMLLRPSGPVSQG